MNASERMMVDRLKKQGYSYQRIAKLMGLSMNTVKSYMQRGGCPQCHAEVSGKKRFCSEACRRAWWNAHRQHPGQASFVCQNCGQSFYGYPAQSPKYCSHACYIAARYGGESHG